MPVFGGPYRRTIKLIKKLKLCIMRPYTPIKRLFWCLFWTIKFGKKLKFWDSQNEVSNGLEWGCFGLQLPHRGGSSSSAIKCSEFGPAGVVTEGAPFASASGGAGE